MREEGLGRRQWEIRGLLLEGGGGGGGSGKGRHRGGEGGPREEEAVGDKGVVRRGRRSVEVFSELRQNGWRRRN